MNGSGGGQKIHPQIENIQFPNHDFKWFPTPTIPVLPFSILSRFPPSSQRLTSSKHSPAPRPRITIFVVTFEILPGHVMERKISCINIASVLVGPLL